MAVRLKSIILVYTFFLTGCTEIIHVATENPIQPEPEKISIGTDIDDWELGFLFHSGFWGKVGRF